MNPPLSNPISRSLYELEDLYFTLKYIARAPYILSNRPGMPKDEKSSSFPGLYWAERHAHDEINDILRHELPEVRLQREREQMEARLFGAYAAVSGFPLW